MPSPRRLQPSMRDVTPGARAFFDDDAPASTSTADGAPSAPPIDGTRWDELHKRWTVWLSVELVDAINAAVRATGESRASLVEAALRADPTIAAHL